jgi:hypothetical protein
MKAPSRGSSSFKDTITDVLKREPLSEGAQKFLIRLRNDDRADEIWQADRKSQARRLHSGAFDSHSAYSFIIVVLALRELAEHFDQVNKKVSAANRARKKTGAGEAIKQLTELSAQGHVIRHVREGALLGLETLEPFLAVRSDERGTRRRTIFCRFASNLLRSDTRWHDKEVAALCEIAFNCKGDVTVDMVRSAREAGRREATRKRKRKA